MRIPLLFPQSPETDDETSYTPSAALSLLALVLYAFFLILYIVRLLRPRCLDLRFSSVGARRISTRPFTILTVFTVAFEIVGYAFRIQSASPGSFVGVSYDPHFLTIWSTSPREANLLTSLVVGWSGPLQNHQFHPAVFFHRGGARVLEWRGLYLAQLVDAAFPQRLAPGYHHQTLRLDQKDHRGRFRHRGCGLYGRAGGRCGADRRKGESKAEPYDGESDLAFGAGRPGGFVYWLSRSAVGVPTT